MRFAEWALEVSDIYGTSYGCIDSNGDECEEDEEAMKTYGNLETGDAWVVCPECGKSIYMSDCRHIPSESWECLYCGFKLEEEEN